MMARSVFLILCVSVSVSVLVGELNADVGRISVRDHWMTDQYGRVRIFHGFNAVNKAFPWYPGNLLNETKLRLYREWGFTAVRVGTMWAGAQPTKHGMNNTYITILETIVNNLHRYGMHAIMDMHQDVISSKFDSYDGVPRWLIDSFPPSPHPYPWPLSTVDPWDLGYLTQAVGVAFQHLYNNTSGAMNEFSGFWSNIAETFREHDNVLGYELINEPWAGDIYSDPLLLLPGIAGKVSLQPTYEILHKAIRQVDEETLLFYEPVTWGNFLNGEVIGSGFSSVPGGPLYANTSVFSYHYYCFVLEFLSTQVGKSRDDYPIFKRVACDDVIAPTMFESVIADVKKTGGSLFLTEFGECQPDGNPNSTATIECNAMLKLTDDNLQSWTYWDSAFFDGDGNIRNSVVKAFARPYPRATAGVPVSINFDPQTKVFKFHFLFDPKIQADTELVVPSTQYPGGFDVFLTPEGFSFTLPPIGGEPIVCIKYKHAKSKININVHVTIKPKSK